MQSIYVYVPGDIYICFYIFVHDMYLYTGIDTHNPPFSI